MATHSCFLAWEIPWTEEPGGLQSWDRRLGYVLACVHAHTCTSHLKAHGHMYVHAHTYTHVHVYVHTHTCTSRLNQIDLNPR